MIFIRTKFQFGVCRGCGWGWGWIRWIDQLSDSSILPLVKPHNSALGTPADTATPTATLTDTPTTTPTDRTWSNRNSPTDPHSNKKVLMLISFKSPPPHPPSVAVLSVRKSHSMPGPPPFETDSSVSQQPIYLKPFNTMIHRKNNKMALGPPTGFHNRILLINLVQKPTYQKNRDIIEILFFLTRSIHLGVGKNIANLISIIFL